ncbi:hypothetical protein [Embleya sp. NPDC020630]|uniref:hypothetical protein n=1 Tax=Embleya sp. NPDC020630 TaxID=3363979 RepID=UPI0037B87CA6
MSKVIAGAVSLAKRATCADIERAVALRDSRARAAIVAALRAQQPRVGRFVSVVSRRPVDEIRQVVVIECLEMPADERYVVAEAALFGFGAADEVPPRDVRLFRYDTTDCRWRALLLAERFERELRAPRLAPTLEERVRAVVAHVVEQAVAVRDEDYSDVSAYVDEAAAELLALGVGSQVTR